MLHQLDFDTMMFTNMQHYDTIAIPLFDITREILGENVFRFLRDQQLMHRKQGETTSFFWELRSGDIVINCKHELKIAPTYKLKVIHSRSI